MIKLRKRSARLACIWASASLAVGCLFTSLPLPVSRRQAPGAAGEAGYLVFWGDLHVHTDFSSDFRKPPYPGGTAADCPHDEVCEDDSGIDYMFRNARRAGLDFVAVTDHAEDLTGAEWESTREAVQRHHRPGRFTTIQGYEFCDTQGSGVGCANLLFQDPGPAPLMASNTLRKASTEAGPEYLPGFGDLCDRLGGSHPSAVAFIAYSQGRMYRKFTVAERNLLVGAEVTTTGGGPDTIEYRQCHNQFIDGMRGGLILGALGSSNSHEALPGRESLTAVLARDVNREALFEALRARRTYATRGERIALSLDVDGRLMGEVYVPEAAPGPRTVRISAAAVHHDRSLASLSLFRLKGGARTRISHLEEVSQALRTDVLDTLQPGDSAAYWAESALQGAPAARSPEAWSSPVFVRIPPP